MLGHDTLRCITMWRGLSPQEHQTHRTAPTSTERLFGGAFVSVEHTPGSLTAGGDAREIHLAEPTKPPVIPPSPEIPDTYGENRLIFLVRDPDTLFAAWEVTTATLNEVRAHVGQDHDSRRLTLRINAWEGNNTAPRIIAEFDVEGAHDWYVNHHHAGSVCQAELGVKNGDVFHSIMRSSRVGIPSGMESSKEDVHWASIEEVLERSRQGYYRESSRF